MLQDDIAVAYGIPQSSVSKIETGERSLLLNEIDPYAMALGVPPEALFEAMSNALVDYAKQISKTDASTLIEDDGASPSEDDRETLTWKDVLAHHCFRDMPNSDAHTT